MILKHLSKIEDQEKLARYTLVIGQFSFIISIFLSRWQRESTALLSGILLGISIVTNIAYLRFMPCGNR